MCIDLSSPDDIVPRFGSKDPLVFQNATHLPVLRRPDGRSVITRHLKNTFMQMVRRLPLVLKAPVFIAFADERVFYEVL